RPDRCEAVAASGDEFVRVALVGGVPDEPVFGRVEHAVQGERELDHPKIGGEVTSGLGDRLDDGLSAVLGELSELPRTQALEVTRTLDAVKNIHVSDPAGLLPELGYATRPGADSVAGVPLLKYIKSEVSVGE